MLLWKKKSPFVILIILIRIVSRFLYPLKRRPIIDAKSPLSQSSWDATSSKLFWRLRPISYRYRSEDWEQSNTESRAECKKANLSGSRLDWITFHLIWVIFLVLNHSKSTKVTMENAWFWWWDTSGKVIFFMD